MSPEKKRIKDVLEAYGIGHKLVNLYADRLENPTLEELVCMDSAYEGRRIKERINSAVLMNGINLDELASKLFEKMRSCTAFYIQDTRKFAEAFGIKNTENTIEPEYLEQKGIYVYEEGELSPNIWLAKDLASGKDKKQLMERYAKKSKLVGLFEANQGEEIFVEELGHRIKLFFHTISPSKVLQMKKELKEALCETLFEKIGEKMQPIKEIDGNRYLLIGKIKDTGEVWDGNSAEH